MFGAIQRVISGENIQHQEQQQQRHQHSHGEEVQGQNIIGNGDGDLDGGGRRPPNTQSSRTTTNANTTPTNENSLIDMVVDSPRRSGGSTDNVSSGGVHRMIVGPALVEDNDDDDMMDVERDHNHDEDGDDHMGAGAGGGGGGELGPGGAGSNSPMQEVTHVEGNDNSTTGSSISDVSTQHEINSAHHFHHDGVLQLQSNPEVIMAPAPSAAGPLPPRASSSTSDNNAAGQGAAGPTGGIHAQPHPPLSTPPRIYHQHNNNFRDGDSRASSQNSSRDWGWFDDVNTTGSLGSLTALDNKAKQQGSRSKPPGAGQPIVTIAGRDTASSTNDEQQQGQHSTSHQSTEDHNSHQRQKQSSPSSSARDSGDGSGNPSSSVVRTPTTRNRGLGLLPNIGLMMESPNHSASGNTDDDYYFNPDSQEMLEPIIIPGISPRDMEDGTFRPCFVHYCTASHAHPIYTQSFLPTFCLLVQSFVPSAIFRSCRASCDSAQLRVGRVVEQSKVVEGYCREPSPSTARGTCVL